MVKKGNQQQRRVVIVGEGLGMLNGLVAGVSHGGSDINGRDHVASSFFSRHTNRSSPKPHPPQNTMSVQLNPSSSLGFRSELLMHDICISAHYL